MAKDKSENTAFRAKMQELASQYDSNQAFADKLGISRQTLGFWLHNDPKKRRSPDMDGLIKVSKALNMSIDYLVGLSESNSLDADIQAVSKYTGLSEKAINAMNDDRFQADMGCFLSEFAEHLECNTHTTTPIIKAFLFTFLFFYVFFCHFITSHKARMGGITVCLFRFYIFARFADFMCFFCIIAPQTY